MLVPPRKYRMIIPNLTVSGPLESSNVLFLKASGCRKIMTVGGGFVSQDVIPQIKANHMSATHYSFSPFEKLDNVEESMNRIFSHLVEQLSSGSKVHISGDMSLIDIACIVGCFRRAQGWNMGYAISEAIDISDNVEMSDMINVISSFNARDWQDKFQHGEIK